MFGAFFGSILGKVSAGLLLVTLVACGWLYVEHLSDGKDIAEKDTKISKQQSKIDDLTGTVDNLNKQLKTQAELDAAADKTRANTKTDTDTIVKKDQTVSQKTHTKIAQIEGRYASMPQTADNIAKKDAEVSRTRITALADVFCNSYPNDATCSGGGAAASAPAASAAASH
jgi:hypothetical protein